MKWNKSDFNSLRKDTILIETELETDGHIHEDAFLLSNGRSKTLTKEELILIYARGFRHAVEVMRIYALSKNENNLEKLDKFFNEMIESCENDELYCDEMKLDLLAKRKKNNRSLISKIHSWK
jgi:hypothetical protein